MCYPKEVVDLDSDNHEPCLDNIMDSDEPRKPALVDVIVYNGTV